MPIRFRCRHCNQLMGIAHRKAGAQVNCPKCGGAVIVPGGAAEPVAASAPPPAAMFERADFDALLQPSIVDPPGGPPPAPALPEPPPALGTLPPAPPEVLAPARPRGLVLSPARATVLTVTLIVLLALAFGAGLLVGRFFLGA
jgi:hypothetical protein